MIIVMPTVPYSGTHFLKHRILNEDWHFDHRNPDKPPGANTIYSSHYETHFISRWVELVTEYPTVIVMRHPYRNKIACERRPILNHVNMGWLHNWTGLLTVAKHFKDVMYLHVDDCEIREEQAGIIRKRFRPDLDPVIDWTLNDKTNTKSDTHKLEIQDDLAIPKEFINFYEETKL